MKKLLVMILALATTLCVLFTAGCSNNTPTPAPTPSNPPSTTEPTNPTPEPEEQPSTTPETPANTGTGTADDPYDFSTMPDQLESGFTWWEIDAVDYEPQILHEVSSPTFDMVISIPEIDDELANFAQSRGDSYILIVAKSKTDDRQQAQLLFYNDTLGILYDEGVGFLSGGGKPGTVPYAFMYSLAPITNTTLYGIVRDLDIAYQGTHGSGQFTDTSFSVPAEAIEAIINEL